ncbi:helix-turn-helix transcriptional regulator [Pseudomonas oryzihabitans]|uniref:helix-turn-helix transcriptional regulator n=1 Tax=Pseudomonas oryzihabitans TaxID=47885 RepID=UPI00111EA641|nr:helix-turn-helix domain-containing protein [Pseudomonas psychrotolerans]QDD92103.1 DNA-binding protein [Pseudomonas psychrotolerans]
MSKPYLAPTLTPEEVRTLHALPDDALVTAQEAAAFLRLRYNTLAWYRSHGGGPCFVRLGPKMIRYRVGDLRHHAQGQAMGEGMRRSADAMLATRTCVKEG